MRLAAVIGALALGTAAVGCQAPAAELDVAYDVRFGASTTMDVFMPAGNDGGRPGVLLIHGGGWKIGTKRSEEDAAQRLAQAGYVAATINYRLVQDGGAFPAAVQDCLCALAFFRANASRFRLDPSRVAVGGYSAGGHLAALVGVAATEPGLAPDCAAGPTGLPQAVISGAGPTDLRPFHGTAVREFMGGSPEARPAEYALASPIVHVGPGKPPYLFVHGRGDVFVPIGDSHGMRDALRSHGNVTRVLEVAGGGHLLNPDDDAGSFSLGLATDQPEAWLATIDFLHDNLGAP